MADVILAERPMGLEAFFAFLDDRPSGERWWLDDGTPVMNPMPTIRHDWIQSNIIMALRTFRRERGANWRPIGPSQVPVAGRASTRAPDVLVVPEPERDDVSITREPIVVFEVLSKSDTPRRRARTFEDYRSISSIRHYVTVRQDRRLVVVYDRDAAGSFAETPATDAVVLTAIGVTLPLDVIYEDTPLAR